MHFIRRLVDDLRLPKQGKVLDLACGKGRHSRILHEHGYDVLGTDLSENSISEARKFETEGLRFAVHDMREVIPSEQFSAVFNLFTSFGYFDSEVENRQVIQAVSSMLDKQGLFVIDFMNMYRVIDTLVEYEEKVVDGILFKIQRRFDGKHIFKNIQFTDNGTDHSYTERVQGLTLEDFERLLSDENFEILRTFGDFDLNSYDKAKSDRLIIIAQKK